MKTILKTIYIYFVGAQIIFKSRIYIHIWGFLANRTNTFIDCRQQNHLKIYTNIYFKNTHDMNTKTKIVLHRLWYLPSVLRKPKKFCKLECIKCSNMWRITKMHGHLWIRSKRTLHPDTIQLFDGLYIIVSVCGLFRNEFFFCTF